MRGKRHRRVSAFRRRGARRNSAGRAGFPGQPDQKGAQPWGPGFSGRLSPAAARRIIPQYEEELELTEAQRDIRKAHVRAAEVAVKAAETQFALLDRSGNNVPQIERTKARLEVDAAQAQLEIKIAEMKEVEVRIKYSKKRLEDAKASAAAPLPVRDGRFDPRIDPPPPKGGLRNEDPDPGVNPFLKQRIEDRERAHEEKKARFAEASAAAADAQAKLVRILEIARQGRAAAAEVEAAEAKDREAQVILEKARLELKKLEAALDELGKRGKEPGK